MVPSNEDSLQEEGLCTLKEQVRGLSVGSTALERHGILNEEVQKRLRTWQCALRFEKVDSMRQTALTGQFSDGLFV